MKLDALRAIHGQLLWLLTPRARSPRECPLPRDSGTPRALAVGDHALTGAGSTWARAASLVSRSATAGLRGGVRQPVAALGLDDLTALAQLGQQRADRRGGNAGGVGDLGGGLRSA